jgi:CheY-like chemotaxis protein
MSLIAGKNPLHVLLADDDDEDQEFFSSALNSIAPSIRLTKAVNGEELMNLLKDNRDLPDLIFLDLNMPCKNGLESLMELKQVENLKNIPVLIYSTSAHGEQIEQTYLHGANLYVQKPHSFADIIKVLNEIFSFNLKDLISQPPRSKFVLKLF